MNNYQPYYSTLPVPDSKKVTLHNYFNIYYTFVLLNKEVSNGSSFSLIKNEGSSVSTTSASSSVLSYTFWCSIYHLPIPAKAYSQLIEGGTKSKLSFSIESNFEY